jgi:dienelactone hydrolase
MRLFELSCLILCALCFITLSTDQFKLQKILCVVTLLALTLHLGFEAWRWQMLPLYIACALVLWMTFREQSLSPPVLGVALVTLLLFSLPGFLLPVPSYPETSGKYSVGTFSIDIIDKDRNRVLPTKFWFPIQAQSFSQELSQRQASWLEHHEKVAPAIAKIAAMPGFIFDHLRHFKAGHHAQFNQAEIEDKPLLILSHGRGGIKEMNGFMAMEFASQGYIVIAPDHAQGAMHTVLTDGSEIPFDPKEFAEGENLPDAQYDQRIRELGQKWTRDLIAITNYVQTHYPVLSEKKVITGGHSTGGGTAIEFCNQDERCIGAIALDAWMLPIAETTLSSQLSKPLLSLSGDSRLKYFEPINRERFERLQKTASLKNIFNKEVVIAKANHIDFCDAALLSPYSYFFGQDKGRIDAKRVMHIINRHSLAFADGLMQNRLDNVKWQQFPEEMQWIDIN